MKITFKKTFTKDLDLNYMAHKLLKNNYRYGTFENFLYDYLEDVINFEDANWYDNWYEIETIVYNNLFVYCAENYLDDVLEILKKLKDF